MVASNERLADLARKIRILARRLHHPAPTGVPHQIDHGRKGDVDPVVLCLDRGNFGAFLHQRKVEGAGKGKRDRGERAVTVNHVVHDEKRSPFAMLRFILPERLHLLAVFGVEHRARLAQGG